MTDILSKVPKLSFQYHQKTKGANCVRYSCISESTLVLSHLLRRAYTVAYDV